MSETPERGLQALEMKKDEVIYAASQEILRLKLLLQDLIDKAEPFDSEASLMFSTWKDDERYFGNITVGDLRSLSEAVRKAKKTVKGK